MAGDRLGREVAKATVEFMEGSLPPNAIFEFLIDGGTMRGFGHYDVSAFDFEASSGVIRSVDQPFPDDPIPRKDPGCHFAAGFWSGVISSLRGNEVVLDELACRSRGAPVCEFAPRGQNPLVSRGKTDGNDR